MDHLALSIPVQYQVQFTEPPKRTVNTGMFGQELCIHIGQTFNGVAVHAATITDRGLHPRPDTRPEKTEIWALDGELFRAVVPECKSLSLELTKWAYGADYAHQWKSGHLKSLPDGKIVGVNKHSASTPDEINALIADAQAQLQALVTEELIVVDNMLMRKMPVPVFEAQVIPSMGGTRFEVVEYREEGWRAGFTARAGLKNFQALEQWLNSMQQDFSSSRGKAAFQQRFEIELHEPNYLPHDSHCEQSIVEHSAKMMQELVKDVMRRSDGFVMSWLDWRAALFAAADEPSSQNISSLLDKWDNAVQVQIQDDKARHVKAGHEDTTDWDTKPFIVRALRAMWENRPLDLDHKQNTPEPIKIRR